MAQQERNHDAYRVAWICPLEIELLAAMEMLDEEHQPLPQSPSDHNVYKLGSINGHNIVIASLHLPGNCPAAAVVTQMRMTFGNLKFGLLVGIGGGVPVDTENGPVRLGHVVVSKPTGTHSGVIQYDHGKAMEGRFERTGCLAPPPTALLQTALALSVQQARADHDPVFEALQRLQTNRWGHKRFRHPGPDNDHLYRAEYPHQQERAPCKDAGCDSKERVRRPDIDDPEKSYIVVHRGTIASGEWVVKNAMLRDQLAQQHGLLCFETEAAGALTDFPCIVIRGISDYCDSHKNDLWHGYAAAVAAAYARQLFSHMPMEETKSSTRQSFSLPLDLGEVRETLRFVARQHELNQMYAMLQDSPGRRTAIIYGLGGMGKTQLAIAYAKQQRSAYSAILWLNANDEVSLKRSYARSAERIAHQHASPAYILVALNNQDLDQMFHAVIRWLNEPGNHEWLLICDNYDNPNVDYNPPNQALAQSGSNSLGSDDEETRSRSFDLRRWLPTTDHGAVIVTTRSSEVLLGPSIKLNKLENTGDSLEIIRSTSRRENLTQDAGAANLARELDGFPLALATAGAYLDQVGMSCTEYIEHYRESWLALGQMSPRLLSYDRTLFTTWNLSYEHIKQKSPHAAMLLQLWAYFDHKDLWFELLKAGSEHLPPWLLETTENQLRFHAIMRIICIHGLAEADPSPSPSTTGIVESGGYSVHSCVHSWMRHSLNWGLDENLAWTAIKCVAEHEVMSGRRHGFRTWRVQLRRLVNHARRCADLLNVSKHTDTSGFFLLHIGLVLAETSHADTAISIWERGIAGWKASSTRWNIYNVDTALELAEELYNQSHFQESEAKFKLLLEDCGAVMTWSKYCQAISGLARSYREQYRLRESHCLLQEALCRCEANGEHKSRAYFQVCEDLGNLFEVQGQLWLAEIQYKRATDGFRETLGTENLETLGSSVNLGNLYRKRGRIQEAEIMITGALKRLVETTGVDHWQTLESFWFLGLVYWNQGRLQEAKSLLQQALVGFANINYRGISQCNIMKSMAELCFEMGHFREAADHSKRAVEGLQNLVGPDHPCALGALATLATSSSREPEGQHQAETVFERVLKRMEEIMGWADSDTLSTAVRLVRVYMIRGRLGDAATMIKRVVEGYEWKFGPGLGPQYFPALKALELSGDLHMDLRRPSEAISFYRKALIVAQVSLGKEHISSISLSAKVNSAISVVSTSAWGAVAI